MNEAEYFRQAFNDADFRQAKILEQREQKKAFGGYLIFGIVLVVILTAATLSGGKGWLSAALYINLLVVPAMLYSTARIRLAALEAMNGRTLPSNDKPATASAG